MGWWIWSSETCKILTKILFTESELSDPFAGIDLGIDFGKRFGFIAHQDPVVCVADEQICVINA